LFLQQHFHSFSNIFSCIISSTFMVGKRQLPSHNGKYKTSSLARSMLIASVALSYSAASKTIRPWRDTALTHKQITSGLNGHVCIPMYLHFNLHTHLCFCDLWQRKGTFTCSDQKTNTFQKKEDQESTEHLLSSLWSQDTRM